MEVTKLQKDLNAAAEKVDDTVVKIKLTEVSNLLKEVSFSRLSPKWYLVISWSRSWKNLFRHTDRRKLPRLLWKENHCHST